MFSLNLVISLLPGKGVFRTSRRNDITTRAQTIIGTQDRVGTIGCTLHLKKSPLDPKDKLFSNTSDVLLTVDLLPFCQHVANSLLLEGDVIGHLDLK